MKDYKWALFFIIPERDRNGVHNARRCRNCKLGALRLWPYQVRLHHQFAASSAIEKLRSIVGIRKSKRLVL